LVAGYGGTAPPPSLELLDVAMAMVRREGGAFLQVRVLPRQLTVQPRSYGRAVPGQLGVVKPPGQPSSKGGPANPWAATRVNPEQASKASRESRPAHSTGKAAASGTGQPPRFRTTRRGSGGGTRRKNGSQHGRPTEARGSLPLDCSVGGGLRWASEGPIVPRKPGNAGGGKGPWFWALRTESRRGDWP
jgi:hypothetical protein